MKKLVDVILDFESNSLSFSFDGKQIPEERVLALIEEKIVRLDLTTDNEGVLACVPANGNPAGYKKILEVFSVPYSTILFSFQSVRVATGGVWRMIKEDCTLYAKQSQKCSLAYMSNAEYEELRSHRKID